jgi:hypothetical protein
MFRTTLSPMNAPFMIPFSQAHAILEVYGHFWSDANKLGTPAIL